jgi:hypothetical protein
MSLLDRFLKQGGTALKLPNNVSKYLDTVFKSSVNNPTPTTVQGRTNQATPSTRLSNNTTTKLK